MENSIFEILRFGLICMANIIGALILAQLKQINHNLEITDKKLDSHISNYAIHTLR